MSNCFGNYTRIRQKFQEKTKPVGAISESRPHRNIAMYEAEIKQLDG